MRKITIVALIFLMFGMLSYSQDFKTSNNSNYFEQVSTTINDHQADGTLVAYPNPVIDILNISDEIEYVNIYTVTGVQLSRIKVYNGIINLSNYKTGLYLITTKDKSVKIFKQ